MKTLLPQGFSRSLLSLTTCGYLPYSRQNSLNLATPFTGMCREPRQSAFSRRRAEITICRLSTINSA
jgi:hypothetical protein